MAVKEKKVGVSTLGNDEQASEEEKGEVIGKEGSSSGSDSEEDEEGEDGADKRARELEEDEAEALKRDLGQDLRVGKRVRRENGDGAETEGQQNKSGDGEKPSTQSEQVWKSLKSNVHESNEFAKSEAKEEMVLVTRTYQFAGEQVKEEKLLPASHPDAIKFLASKDSSSTNNASAKVSLPAATTPSLSSTKPQAAGPRKKKSSLAAMSAAATGKPTKINTLEKSKMDWNRFKEQTVGERERDEMEAQTKGGGSGLGSMKGYMERQGFLDRVQGRLEDQKKKE